MECNDGRLSHRWLCRFLQEILLMTLHSGFPDTGLQGLFPCAAASFLLSTVVVLALGLSHLPPQVGHMQFIHNQSVVLLVPPVLAISPNLLTQVLPSIPTIPDLSKTGRTGRAIPCWMRVCDCPTFFGIELKVGQVGTCYVFGHGCSLLVILLK